MDMAEHDNQWVGRGIVQLKETVVENMGREKGKPKWGNRTE